MPQTCQRRCPLGRVRRSGARREYRRRKTGVVELELAREDLLDERGLLPGTFVGSRGPRCGQRRVVAGYGGRVLGDQRLHALDGEPVRGPADAGREHEFLLAQHALKVDFLVLDKVDGADGRQLREGQGPAEDCSRVWAVTKERLDVEDSQCAIDVPGGEGCTPRVTHEARRFLRWGGRCERERQA